MRGSLCAYHSRTKHIYPCLAPELKNWFLWPALEEDVSERRSPEEETDVIACTSLSLSLLPNTEWKRRKKKKHTVDKSPKPYWQVNYTEVQENEGYIQDKGHFLSTWRLCVFSSRVHSIFAYFRELGRFTLSQFLLQTKGSAKLASRCQANVMDISETVFSYVLCRPNPGRTALLLLFFSVVEGVWHVGKGITGAIFFTGACTGCVVFCSDI